MSSLVNNFALCECGNRFPIQQYASINVTRDPHLKEALFDGTLAMFSCPSCGIRSEVKHDLLYHDMERKLMILHATSDSSGVSSIASRPLDICQEALLDYNLRIVGEWNHLLEKIVVFDAGLDDFVFEAVKTQVWLQYSHLSSLAPDTFLCESIVRDEKSMRYQFVDTEISRENAFEMDDSGIYEELSNATYSVRKVNPFPKGEWALVTQQSASDRLSLGE